jgi:RNA polymerase sigma-70 factor (ECF subfamily)
MDYQNKEQLYRAFFKGKADAVCAVVEEYRRGLVLFVNGYVRNFSVAEDVASEAFAKLLVKRPVLENANAFKTYLYSIGKNAALDWLKKHKREKRLEEKYISCVDPDLLLEKHVEKVALLKALDELRENYRCVLHLHYFEDLSLDDAAKVMKKNKKQVYNLLQRAKIALKEILKKEGFDNEEN